jgi:hypothetical protein
MNKAVKVVLTVYFILILLACVYVPWKENMAIAQGTILVGSIKYSPIWSATFNATTYEGAEVDLARVLIEIVGLTALFAIPFMFTYKPEDDYSYFEEAVEDEPEDEETEETKEAQETEATKN